jgi:aryl-alcohol dehydrogenase-like predicted oxidoreductase
MDHVQIPGTDLQASRVALGTWAIGGWLWGGTESNEPIRTIHAALDAGINIIDTAPIYGFGLSEELVGEAIAERGQRDRVILATKAGLEWFEQGGRQMIQRNASRERIRREVEDSLRRLRTDVIDIYQIHWPDPVTEIDETAETMQSLLDEGKIRAVGVSNHDPQQMEAFRQTSALHTAQPPYNLLEREIEADVLPYCRERGLVVLAYGALCRGMLTGKVDAGSRFGRDDLRGSMDPKFKEPRRAQYVSAVKRLDQLARDRFDRGVTELAVRWMLDGEPRLIALWGARRPDQLDPVRRLDGWTVDSEAREQIDRILAEEIEDPVGPEFMAPPARRSP